MRIAGAALACTLWIAGTVLGEGATLEVGRFSARSIDQGLPEDWVPLPFRKIERHTRYELVEEDGRTVVRAESDASASGLIRRMEIDPAEYPIVEWSWKVSNVLEKGDVTKKSGDDYPARLYVTFAYDPERLSFWEKAPFEAARLWYGEYPPVAAINYIWESRAPIGTVVANPYTDRVKMIVVESGAARAGEWVEERRNLAQDYRDAFGGEPPRIDGVAIMTDTDNTGEAATAWYGDVTFHRTVSEEP